MRFDMTRGKPALLLARFALPLIFSSMLQQLYTLCDSAIVGRLLGETAFAAVGAAAFLHGIPLSILLGCTQGFGVAVGHRCGCGRPLWQPCICFVSGGPPSAVWATR